jgi:hypothetical protein
MMWTEGHWVLDHSLRAIVHVKPGDYPAGESLPADAFDHALPTHLLPGLFDAAQEHGLLPTRLKPEPRTEDLKIIHRLLDIMGDS